MIHIDNRFSEKKVWPEAGQGQIMHQPQLTIDARIAKVAHAFELRRMKHARKWVAVFMNEETIVIALHGSLTVAEKFLAQSAAGAAEVQEFHRQLFADVSALLLRKIKNIAGMNVRHTSAEIDTTTGSVVHLFTTDTVGEDFPIGPSGLAEAPRPGLSPLCLPEARAGRQADRTGFVIRG